MKIDISWRRVDIGDDGESVEVKPMSAGLYQKWMAILSRHSVTAADVVQDKKDGVDPRSVGEVKVNDLMTDSAIPELMEPTFTAHCRDPKGIQVMDDGNIERDVTIEDFIIEGALFTVAMRTLSSIVAASSITEAEAKN